MSKRFLKITKEGYTNIRGTLIPFIESYENIRELTMSMNFITKNTLEYYLNAPIHDYLFGVKINMDSRLNTDTIVLRYNDSNNLFDKMKINSLYGMFVQDNIKHITLPDRYIVNKDAAILFYGNNKTIVKRSKGDKIDPVKAFLWAYFLHNTGMSRTKANKYLQEVNNSYLYDILGHKDKDLF